ncbi:hypothetical protein P5V15_015772 [Pogonomyrmex californicus]
MEIESHDTNFLTCGCLEVKILRVESPLLFWVQLKNGEAALEKFHQELHQRMIIKQDQLRYLSDVKQDDIVAVKEGNAWRRDLVTAVLLNIQTARIALRDWGRVYTRYYSDIYFLENVFRELPWQALTCGLAHLTPLIPCDLWSQDTRTLCRILAEERKGWIQIIHPLADGAVLNDR